MRARWKVWLAPVLALLLLGGCVATPQAQKSQIFAMNTIMSLTLYPQEDKAGEQAMAMAIETIYNLERQLSVTQDSSDISAINRATGNWVTVAADTAALVQRALSLCEQSGGALDITAYPAVRAWGFTTGEHRVPPAQELGQLVGRIDYSAMEVEVARPRCRIPQGMELDLGAIAKGHTGDVLAQLLQGQGIASAMLDLGGNVQAIGTRPDGEPWRVGVQNPAGDGYLGVLSVVDCAVVTSGGYQRYFEESGVHYWHIIDPKTAAPARSGLASVTVVGKSGLVCDGLSTALFVMGAQAGADFWRDHPELEFDAVFLLEDGNIQITSGLVETFSLAEGNLEREVTVLS